MSLLLDALKKAAKDKEQAAAADAEKEGRTADDQQQPETTSETPEPASEAVEAELTLDDEVLEEQLMRDAVMSGKVKVDEEQELTFEQEEVRTKTSTVSDQALQMLVHKTNREHRRKQKIIWLGIALASVLILLTGGLYFYSEMVKDIESLERKHRIALQKVNAEVIKRKNPQLVEDFTTLSASTPAATAAQAPPSKPVSPSATAQRKPATTPAKPAQSKTQASIKLEKTRTQDPVGVLLNDAWSAYNRGDLDAATEQYQRVLQREANNRDALLGLGAIAVAREDVPAAQRAYGRLLQLNPRDPVAVPAFASLQQQTLANLDESALKQLLKQQPGASHVSFALGNLKAGEQQWPEAQQYYFDAWQSESGNADYAFNLAVSLEHIGQPQQAAKFYRKSIELAATGSHRFSVDAVRQRLQQLGAQ